MSGLALDILKVESWMQMGRTANIIIKCSIHASRMGGCEEVPTPVR